ncbi:MAG: tetratricopeptide repeat protein [Clostridiales bacterium]|nr:tetratricopeptide repeat protein [Clostridiales bacterium]
MNEIDKEMTAKTLKHLNQLAMQAVRQKNYRQALDSFTQSLVIEEKLGMKAQMAESFFNMATTYYMMEEYQEALNKANFALTLFRQENKADDIAKTQEMICEIKEKTGQEGR